MKRQLKVRVAFGAVLAAYVLAAGLLLRAEPPQAVGTWASLGTTPESRVGAAAVALPDGRTLIAGGSIAAAATDSVVVFDPADGSFASAGHLLLPRVGHTATLLDDGRVLLAGGTAGDLLSADLELFDPSTGNSVLGGAMAQPRTGHAAARLADGRVLIAGGTSTDGVLQSAEIYDPATGATTPTTLPMLVARTGASATTLIDGRVLIAGGNNGTADLASAEIFEASSQIFEAATTSLSVPRSGHAAVLLPWNNSVLIAGGSSNGVAQTTSDLFLPAEFPDPYSYGMGSFAATGSLVTARSSAVASTHIEGYAVAIGGGAPEAEVYRFATIKTDKDDYAPGTKAIITGSGWEPNADVTLVFQEDPAVHDDYILHVTSKSDGTIYWGQWAPEEHDLNVRFYLMAKQPTPAGERRAQTTFTDARNLTLTFSGAGTGSVTLDTTTGIHSGTFKVPVACGGTNSSITSWTFTSTCTSISLNDNDATGTLTANPNAGSAFGGWSGPGNFTGCTSTTSPCAFSVTGSSPAITATFNAAVATTTTVSSSVNPSTYGDSVTFTATVSSTSTPTGSVNFIVDGGSPVAGTPGTTTSTTATWTYATAALNAGNHAVSASYVHSGSFQDSSGSLSGGQVVNKATPTATLAVNNSPQTYTGSGLAATVEISASSVPGAVANILTGGAATQTTAATYAVTADFVPTDTTNYNSLIGLSAGNFVIQKATPTATLAVTNSPQTYTGSGQAATVGINTSSVPGAVANILTGGAATQTTAATYAVTADFVPTDTTNYNSLIGLSAGNFVIQKATPTATLAVTNSPQTYTGSGQAATVGINVSSVPGAVANILTGGAATQTTAATYAVTADFVPTDTTNYNTLTGLAAGNFVIQKATPTATLAVTNSPQTYTGSGLAATVEISASSVPGAVANILTGGAATQTTAATYAVTADFVPTDTTNYNTLTGLAAGNFVIQKATPTATLAVTNSPQTYTGSGLAATVEISASSVPGAVANILTGGAATQTTAATYAVTADFVPTDTTNYNSLIGLSAGNFVIQKATPTATLAVTNSPQTYTGSGQAATVGINVSSVPGTVANILTGGAATQTNAATYAVTADFVPTDTTNYNSLIGLSAGNFVIQKATPTATLAVTNSPQTYTGSGQAATVGINTSSVPGAVANILTGGAATQTTAATYAVTADFVPTDTTNYNSLIGLSAGNFVIQKATPTATLAVTNSPQTYTGSGLAATVDISASSVPGAVANILTGGAATQTTAATYAVTADFVPTDTTNYNSLIGLSAGNFVIQKATPTATLAVTNSPQTYTGSGLAATVGINTSSVPGAVANILTGGAATQTTAATYAVTADFVPTDTTNYNTLTGLAAGNFVIQKATPTATLAVTNSPQTYTGSGQAATVDISAISVPGAVANILTGGAATQTTAATYAVTADFVPSDTTNYNTLTGLAAGNFVIAKANATVVVTPYTVTYDGGPHTATVTSITGVNGETGATVGTVTLNTTHTSAGTYSSDSWSFTGAANYNNIGPTTITDTINKATATVVVTPYNVQWDGNPHTATHTITGVNGETGATVGVVTLNTTHTNAGTYDSDSWSFTPTANYNTAGGATITDVIGTAYCFNGFLSPIGGSVETSNGGSFLNPVKAFKLGSTIPIKFILNSWNGTTCGAVVTTGIHTLQAIYYSSAVDSDPVIDASPTDAATTDNQFRLTNPEWHFNLSTKGAGFKAGTWLLQATLSDGSVHTVWITIKR